MIRVAKWAAAVILAVVASVIGVRLAARSTRATRTTRHSIEANPASSSSVRAQDPFMGKGFAVEDAAIQEEQLPEPEPVRTSAELAELARSTDDGWVKQEIVQELKFRGAAEALPTFVLFLRDSEPDVRIVAAEGLEDLRDQSAIAPLTKALEDEADEEVATVLREVLESLRSI